MTDPSPANDPTGYRAWVNQLEEEWKAGLIPDRAALRELTEETGLDIHLSHWKFYKRQPENHVFIIEQHIYYGMTHQEVNDMTLGEGQALRFFRREELPALPIAFGFDKILEEFFDQSMRAAC